MVYKDILVHVDKSTACSARIDAALDLARRFEAHLTALYLMPEIVIPVAAESYMGASLYTSIEQQEQERADEVLLQFRESAEANNVAYETRTDKGNFSDFADRLEVHSRYTDLLVIGQPDQADDLSMVPAPGDVALCTTAPILVTPFIGLKDGVGKRVMIAWNGKSRGDARHKERHAVSGTGGRRRRCHLPTTRRKQRSWRTAGC